jgi:hypothetical protein
MWYRPLGGERSCIKQELVRDQRVAGGQSKAGQKVKIRIKIKQEQRLWAFANKEGGAVVKIIKQFQQQPLRRAQSS